MDKRQLVTAAWRYAGIQVKWSAGFQISICLADKSFSENPHNAKPQNVSRNPTTDRATIKQTTKLDNGHFK